MTRSEIRYEDYSLDDTQEALRQAVRQFFAKECPSSVVRAAEPSGFDRGLWSSFEQIGGSFVAPGGDGASLVDLAVVAEEVGRAAAPLPFVSDVVARRLLVALGADPPDGPLTLAPQPVTAGVPHLVPDAGAASGIVAVSDGHLGVYPASGIEAVANQGSSPLAWWTPGSALSTLTPVPAAGALYDVACREWKILTAAALVGLTETALAQAVTFAKDRHTLGVPIGALQGVSFPLADIVIGTSSARHLIWKAAWFADNEPDSRPELALMAYAFASRTAVDGTTAAAHVHGGLGFSVETDVTLYFLRARGWSLAGGDAAQDLRAVGAGLWRNR